MLIKFFGVWWFSIDLFKERKKVVQFLFKLRYLRFSRLTQTQARSCKNPLSLSLSHGLELQSVFSSHFQRHSILEVLTTMLKQATLLQPKHRFFLDLFVLKRISSSSENESSKSTFITLCNSCFPCSKYFVAVACWLCLHMPVGYAERYQQAKTSHMLTTLCSYCLLVFTS